MEKPVRKTWQAVFNADWKLLRYAYLKDGEISPTWFLHWDDCMRELMANDEAKTPAVTMASLATVAYDPLAITFAHVAWASLRLEGESDEDHGHRLAEVPPSEQTSTPMNNLLGQFAHAVDCRRRVPHRLHDPTQRRNHRREVRA